MNMRVLVVGGGGREHALVWKLASSFRVGKVYAVPGNAGMSKLAECHAIPLAEDFAEIANFAERQRVDLTVVGPEVPLVGGIVDVFQARGLSIFGPTRDVALLEGSKDFAKRMMAKYRIPTAESETFLNPHDARTYIRRVGAPIVVKADGLAAGKGVVVCETVKDALNAIEKMMITRVFEDAGARIVIEEFLVGEEVSFILLCDGMTAIPMATSQDHKRAYDNDAGPNTGGMGAYSPVPVVDDALHARIMDEIVRPLMIGLEAEGICYRGLLYVGVMVTDAGPKVLEFNCRLGDPEVQALITRLDSDLVDALEAATRGTLVSASLRWRSEASVCVVMAAGDYPAGSSRGAVIRGLDQAARRSDTVVFHAGTALKEGQFVTNGGRILGVTALGSDIRTAIRRAYEAVGDIHFENAHYRRDIGWRALCR